MKYPKIAQLKTVDALRDRLEQLDLQLPVDDQILDRSTSPMAEPLEIGPYAIGNRWCIHPMEGWDANADGSPSEHTLRRWKHFGLSGAKLIWGGEAVAVRPDGRANPRQTLGTIDNREGLAQLLDTLLDAHRKHIGSVDDLLVSLQLTHSGRFSRPNSKQLEPKIAYHHPLLDAKFHIASKDDSVVWTDDELEQLIEDYLASARIAWEVGFPFVDIKACHGYLLHEFLSARRRPGRFGGDLAGRSRLLLTIVRRIQDELPELGLMVRLSIYDTLPYEPGETVGRPMDYKRLLPYECGFGVDRDDPTQIDLTEPIELLQKLRDAGVLAVNLSCGSPYYCPHIQRPAIFPPSDGYQPPEDPLVGVVRQIETARQCKAAVDDLPMVGTGYTYLQDYLPHVAQAVVREGWIDSVGLGRMVLSYPTLPIDTLSGRTMDRKRICRTFSDCTTAPRQGIISGCYPLDGYYKTMDEAQQLKVFKSASAP